MAFRLVDPPPFLPEGAQRVVVPGRPVMRRVVVGHVAQRNSDLAIAILHPMPEGPVAFGDIRDVIEDFLRNHAAVDFRSMQPCSLGQA